MMFKPTIGALAVVAGLFSAQLMQAQDTSFTYQGFVRNGDGAANGTFDLRFKVFADAVGSSQVGNTVVKDGVSLSNGLFTVSLDAGPNVFTGASRWLEVALKTNGAPSYTVLSPLQPITAAPYSMFAGSASNLVGNVSASQLPASVVLDNASQVSLSGTFAGNAAGLTNLNASALATGTVPDARLAANVARTNQVWLLGGNAGANPTNGAFIGSTDDLPLEFRVNGIRALRLEPVSNLTVNVIGGAASNRVINGAMGATIAGGGWLAASEANIVGGNLGTVGGGRQNSALVAESTIAGGRANTASGGNSSIGGGYVNSASGTYATIAGGIGNAAASDSSTVAGGAQNTIQAGAIHSAIGGGANNVITSNSFRGTVAGGTANIVGAPEGTVAGGAFNKAIKFSATVGGGGNNAASGEWSTIAGGRDNVLTNADYAVIGGGVQNGIQTNAPFSTIGGGGGNAIRTNAQRGTVGGGWLNSVAAPEGTVAGGAFNNALGISATVGGGGNNSAGGDWSTIAGGRDNVLSNAHYATIGGGVQNTIQPNGFAATIPGGWLNSAADFGFAAGRRAKANHTGAFVWADATDADFASTGTNQFLIRASGGVGINNNNPNGAALAVGGDVNVEGIVSVNALSAATITTPQLHTPRIITPQVGTTNSAPVELHVNGQRALRIEPKFDGAIGVDTVNVIEGSSANYVGAFAWGATIGGGGNAGGDENSIVSPFGTIGGGRINHILQGGGHSVIGGGLANTITNHGAGVIAGGSANELSAGESAAIGGGTQNRASGFGATVPGGRGNFASGDSSFASGEGTRASALAATSMGYYTTASGPGSTALGVFSKARHNNTFVWSDGTDAQFGSSANNQFLVNASGGVGLGTTNPVGALHVYSAANPTTVRIQSTGTPGFGRVEFVSNPQGDAGEWRPAFIQSLDAGGFTGGLGFYVNGTGIGNRFATNEAMRIQNGRVGIGNTAPSTLLQVGNATCNGTTWNNASDKHLKGGFAPVDPQKILATVASLPIRSWHYTNEPGTQHVGPMAQDFHAAFGLGADEKRIATVDADGVALAAIQGLNQKLEETRAENAQLRARLDKLERLLQTR